MTYEILIIEDDTGIANSLQSGLEREGYHIVWAATGADGLRYLRRQKPHLIILDIRLPDGSGFDFCRQIREMRLTQPIIMLTVQRDETDKVLGLEMGADDYVTKPFSLRELVSRIRAQLRRAYGEFSNSDGEVVYVGDLTIDLTRGQVYRDAEPLNVTPTEFRLIVFMARHPNQVLSRQQILDGVWGYGPDLGSDDVVKVNIRRLREKIEVDPGNPVRLLTVPGIGYRLRC